MILEVTSPLEEAMVQLATHQPESYMVFQTPNKCHRLCTNND